MRSTDFHRSPPAEVTVDSRFEISLSKSSSAIRSDNKHHSYVRFISVSKFSEPIAPILALCG